MAKNAKSRFVWNEGDIEILDEDVEKKDLTKFQVVKISGDEQRLVYGWFSVVEKNGEPVVDTQDHIISPDVLQKAVHAFIGQSRVGKVMHEGSPVSALVDSMVFTKDVQKALGIDLGVVGWFGAFKVLDDAAWAAVKKGDLPAFSIAGFAVGVAGT